MIDNNCSMTFDGPVEVEDDAIPAREAISPGSADRHIFKMGRRISIALREGSTSLLRLLFTLTQCDMSLRRTKRRGLHLGDRSLMSLNLSSMTSSPEGDPDESDILF